MGNKETMSEKENLLALSRKELEERINVLRGELFKLKSAIPNPTTHKPHLFAQKRREVARMLTIIRQKELAG